MALPLAERTVGAIFEALAESFNTYWAGETSVAWDNKTFRPDDVEEYVRFSVQHTPGASGPAGLEAGSAKRYRRLGFVFVQVFTKAGSGRARSDALVDKALKFFEVQAPPAGVAFQDPSPAEVGRDGGWFQVNVSSGFQYDTLRA